MKLGEISDSHPLAVVTASLGKLGHPPSQSISGSHKLYTYISHQKMLGSQF